VPSRTDINHCLITKDVVANKIVPTLTLAKTDKKNKKEESA